jgi:hypothetical protein
MDRRVHDISPLPLPLRFILQILIVITVITWVPIRTQAKSCPLLFQSPARLLVLIPEPQGCFTQICKFATIRKSILYHSIIYLMSKHLPPIQTIVRCARPAHVSNTSTYSAARWWICEYFLLAIFFFKRGSCSREKVLLEREEGIVGGAVVDGEVLTVIVVKKGWAVVF